MKEKNLILISGFNVNDNNRGTAALSFGAISFLQEKGFLEKNQTLVNFRIVKNLLKRQNRGKQERYVSADDIKWKHVTYNVFFLEIVLFTYLGILIPFTTFGKILKRIKIVAAINGGDGFSDIYGTEAFLRRLNDTNYAMQCGIPLIILPQTIGPFNDSKNRAIADKIISYAIKVYVRDNKFTEELKKMGVDYELTKDLSAYMKPQPWDIIIERDSIGINISGLAYSNRFRSLAGQFKNYPILIDKIIKYFQKEGKTVYLIPHSYNYTNPEEANDDIVACREAYNKLDNKNGVFFIDKNLSSPQVKYVISKMSFFIGTRMHANFAAIYSNVPVFGLSYSYKFEGAFNANGLDGSRQTARINNMKVDDIPSVINKIDAMYREVVKFKN